MLLRRHRNVEKPVEVKAEQKPKKKAEQKPVTPSKE